VPAGWERSTGSEKGGCTVLIGKETAVGKTEKRMFYWRQWEVWSSKYFFSRRRESWKKLWRQKLVKD